MDTIFMMTEADTCRKYVLPKLIQAGWDNAPHSFTKQKTFTDGRIVGSGHTVRRRPQKRADYLLRYTRVAAMVANNGTIPFCREHLLFPLARGAGHLQPVL